MSEPTNPHGKKSDPSTIFFESSKLHRSSNGPPKISIVIYRANCLISIWLIHLGPSSALIILVHNICLHASLSPLLYPYPLLCIFCSFFGRLQASYFFLNYMMFRYNQGQQNNLKYRVDSDWILGKIFKLSRYGYCTVEILKRLIKYSGHFIIEMSRLSVPDLDILLVLKYWCIGAMHAHSSYPVPRPLLVMILIKSRPCSLDYPAGHSF